MKKLLSLLLVLGLLVSLAGCAFYLPIDEELPTFGEGFGDYCDDVYEEPTDALEDLPSEQPTQDIPQTEPEPETEPEVTVSPAPDEDGTYTSKEDVALYIHHYGHLPNNFITKSEARKLGWKSGSLEKYAPGKCIGGDRFGNYEGLLPKAPGRTYTECDIDTLGAKSRGPKRIVFSNDGLVYYTDDHYESFTLLYGEE